MVSNDDFDGKATNLNCFYLHINFEQKYPKPAIVICNIILHISDSMKCKLEHHINLIHEMKVFEVHYQNPSSKLDISYQFIFFTIYAIFSNTRLNKKAT